MACSNVKKLCDKIVVSSAVTFTDGNLVVNLPAGSYQNRNKYCVIIAQNIPTDATITAPVVFTIGTDTTTYPLVNADCTAVYACSINKRTRYSVCVFTDIASGVFKLFEKIPCSRCADFLDALPATTTTPPVVGG